MLFRSTGAKTQILDGHNFSVYSVSWNADGKHLAVATTDPEVILRDVNNRESIQKVKGHFGTTRSVSWSPDGKKLASGACDNTVIIWNVK